MGEREIWRGQSVLESEGLELERVGWESESDWNLFSNETNSAVPREDSSENQRTTSKYTNVNTKKEYF